MDTTRLIAGSSYHRTINDDFCKPAVKKARSNKNRNSVRVFGNLGTLAQTPEVSVADNLVNEKKKLSVPERILLVEEIWDGIAREDEVFELSDA